MSNSKYEVGQIWKYKNRPGEDDSRLSIHAIDHLTIHGRDQIVMYIQVDNIFSNTSGLGFVFTEDAIDRSVVELTDCTVAELNLVDSKLVLDAIRKGELQCIDTTVAELIQTHENSLREDAKRTERTYAFIKDPYNPSLDELRWWAYDEGAGIPDQDYELILARDEFYEDILRFAADPSCPKQRFFLSCLYMINGGSHNKK